MFLFVYLQTTIVAMGRILLLAWQLMVFLRMGSGMRVNSRLTVVEGVEGFCSFSTYINKFVFHVLRNRLLLAVYILEGCKANMTVLPISSGISLTEEQWANFKKNVPAIEKAITKMESQV